MWIGAFCTPRSVQRSITSTNKPIAAELVVQMKKLEETGVGKFWESEREKVFYKLIPKDDNRELIQEYVDFDKYIASFEENSDTKSITQAQCADC